MPDDTSHYLDGLPNNCVVNWNHIPQAGKGGMRSEDMVWVGLPDKIISIDGGAYGWPREVLRVDVVVSRWAYFVYEYSYCRDEAEMASEVVRLANKYMDPVLAKDALIAAHNHARRIQRKQDEAELW